MQTSQKLVSVIIPTFNRSNELQVAIQSVLAQDYPNVEIIIVDDGSTDDTSTYFSEPHPFIAYLSHFPNRGIGYSRAKGIENAQGEYICFLDSDDEWLPGKLTYQTSILENHPEIDLLFGGFQNVNTQNNSNETGFNQTKIGLEHLQAIQIESDLYKITGGFPEALLLANFIATSSVIFKRDIVKSIGNFNPNLSGPEDLEFWWRVGLSNYIIAYSTQTFCQRTKNATSISLNTSIFIPKVIEALNICLVESNNAGRQDLFVKIKQAQRQLLENLTRIYAIQGQRKKAWNTLVSGLKLGASKRSIINLAAIIIGPKAIKRYKQLKA